MSRPRVRRPSPRDGSRADLASGARSSLGRVIPTAPDGYVLIPEAALGVFVGIVALACFVALACAVYDLIKDTEPWR